MTANGWIQIALYCLAIIVCVKPLGLYMARVFEGEIKFLAPVERAIYRVCGVKGEEQHWTTYTIAMLAFSIAGFVSLYLMQRLPGGAALQSAGHGGGDAGPVLQHLDQLHHQHQLAVLFRRNHHVLSGADAGADGA